MPRATPSTASSSCEKCHIPSNPVLSRCCPRYLIGLPTQGPLGWGESNGGSLQSFNRRFRYSIWASKGWMSMVPEADSSFLERLNHAFSEWRHTCRMVYVRCFLTLSSFLKDRRLHFHSIRRGKLMLRVYIKLVYEHGRATSRTRNTFAFCQRGFF